MVKSKLLLTIVLLSIGWNQYEANTHIPSSERGDPNYRREANIDINKVGVSIFNYGITGRPSGGNPSWLTYEWPMNSGKRYIAMTALSVGSEVIDEDGVARPLVTIPFRSDQSGNSKSWEPIPGYLNANSTKIAKSDDEDTWPLDWPDKMDDQTDPGWAGSWNGYFGKNNFNAEQEIYCKVSDDLNFEPGWEYLPDSTDLIRRGAGLLTAVRVMEWNQILIEDVVFILHEIKNDGTKDLEKVAFSLWLADLVGGDGDSGDDTPDFDLIYDVAWSMDSDGIGNSAFGSDPVGVAATSFIETPGNNVDRIDNDGDGEDSGPIISEEMIEGEILGNAIDDNGNGLIDENMTHVPFGDQIGVSFSDKIDNNGNAEQNSPIITEDMVNQAFGEWNIWPPLDELQNNRIHVIGLGSEDLNKPFADGIDNNNSDDYPYGTGAEIDSPVVDTAMVELALSDPYFRYFVPGSDIVIYNVGWEDLGLRYADGIDNDLDGAVDEGIDEGIDEMIDESRDDFIDNDNDWVWSEDDNGLYGDGSGGLIAGSNDSKPTSGSGSGFPGEPNIDKTDVAESDQMGLTGVGYDPAGSIPVGNSLSLWAFYMSPGNYWQPPAGGQPPGDYDLFVTSSFFPLKAGQTERIAMAVTMGNDEADALRNKTNAQTAYDFDYRFAKSPNPPVVSAVPGDGTVTLYWDSSSEDSYDAFMKEIDSNPYDFEGYKIFRATDYEFNDAYHITDGEGNLTFYEPYSQEGEKAQWDIIDGISGWHEVDLNGVKFWMGDDTGLQHSYIDSNVVNGQTYFYAVVAYDFGGDISNNITPSDSPMRLRVNSLTGDIEMGSNVIEIVPTPPSAGYIPGNIENEEIVHISGTSSGIVNLNIIDPMKIKENHIYRISFEDTLLLKNPESSLAYDTLTTGKWYLEDLITGDTIVSPEFLVLDTLYTYEPFVDVGNGQWDSGEPLEDINSDGIWNDAEPLELVENDVYQYEDLNHNGQWDDAECYEDLGDGIWSDSEDYEDINDNGIWDIGESFDDLDGNGECGVSNGADNNEDGYCDGEQCADVNNNGECDSSDQPYFQIIYDGICNCPEPFDDINSNFQYDEAEPLTDENSNGIWDNAEIFVDINENEVWDASILETIIDSVIYINPLPEGDDYKIIDGFRLKFDNEKDIRMNTELSHWNNPNLWDFTVRTYVDNFGQGAALPSDYRVIFTEEKDYESDCYCSKSIGDACGESMPTLCQTIYFEPLPVNFYVQKRLGIEDGFVIWEDIPFAFGDFSPYDTTDFLSHPDGYFNADWREQDWVVFLDHQDEAGDPRASWLFRLSYPGTMDGNGNEPQAGDTAFVYIRKPFLTEDVYEFTTNASYVDIHRAQNENWKDKVKVVPNPYFAANEFESQNTFSSGRGPREIQFRYLPSECTIRIYNIAGELVDIIDHNVSIDNGTESWDLLTMDNLSASYGIYIYHIQTPELGEFVGKFAIIK
jgi:hypothetical protein